MWTDTVTSYAENEIGEIEPVTAQEIFASGMIHQQEKTTTETNEDGTTRTGSSQTVRWSKPYRLTRENAYNDGIALALDTDGSLLIVHNRYTKETVHNESELMQRIAEGRIGLTQDKEGNYYATSMSYNSPVSLVVTRFDKVGSLEASNFEFSDLYPVAGETVSVSAAVENVGLTDAEGCEVRFYEFKDGVRGRQIGETVSYNESIQVNTARRISIPWTVPEEGADGYSIQAVIREKRSDGSYYDASVSNSASFAAAPFYRVKATEAVQQDDLFPRQKLLARRDCDVPLPSG